MKYPVLQISIILLLTSLFLDGCYTSQSVTSFTELEDADSDLDAIRALTTDSSLYTFETFSFTETTLRGKGTVKKENATEDFEGALSFTDIVFIERLESNGWKALWIVPMSIAIASGVVLLMEPSEFNMRRPSEGSCPFVYSYNGSSFVLEGEAFSTAISQALEAQSYHVLSSLVPSGNELTVRVRNERPETHLFNSVDLFVVDAKGANTVVLDTQNRAWPIYYPIPPVTAQDHSGTNTLHYVDKKDGNYWKSDLKNIFHNAGYRDTLQGQFEIPPGTSEVTLVVDAINSRLITEVYRAAGGIIGDEALSFYHTLEHDPDLKSYFEDWIQRSSLLVEVAVGDSWQEAGRILPEANEVPFTRAVRLQNLDNTGQPLNVRVSSMTDVWHIDALSVDVSKQPPLEMYPLEMTEAVKSGNVNVDQLVTKSDSLYAITLPPDYIDLVFDGTPAAGLEYPVFIFAAQGFLYEWFPEAGDFVTVAAKNWMNKVDRKEMLKRFKQQENLFLYSIYSRWSLTNR
ncbi:hypothetical protein NC796_24850 [Aliifodinibius sp. S!AR15-10]|uniref:hypothetical protein n=1 Tax=Aliifodinibius sp. S!AR15-10 TaxID=2950437 RepID=UPI00285E49ED|nr:hypothetical protein [Aliifodinibius sp. S!AR15-10]MDR8394401.1 hypothetical protein [Aliifodinibius sp. S!AR15-10]